MSESTTNEAIETFRLIENFFTEEDISYLKQACKEYILKDGAIPSYVLLDKLESGLFRKIASEVAEQINGEALYLNDFYIYSDNAFGAQWHMDTELFTFEECLNAWILLDPEEISSPVAMLPTVNDAEDNYYHIMEESEGGFKFSNITTKANTEKDTTHIEKNTVDAPNVKCGDLLILNPKKFHRTNTTAPKHAVIIKFVVKRNDSILSNSMVMPIYWPEVGIFSKHCKNAEEWSDFIESIKEELQTPNGRKSLGAGFWPEKMDLYRAKVAEL